MQPFLILVVTCLIMLQGQSSVVAQRNQERGGQGGMQGQRGQGQRGRQGQRGEQGRSSSQRQTPLLLRVFDADGDDVLSSKEIADASKVLMKLDKNEDGKLTADEFRLGSGRPGQQGSASQGPQSGRQGQGNRSGGGQQGARSGGAQQGGRTGGGQQGGRSGGGGRRGGDAQFAQQIMELDANKDNLISSDEIPPHMRAAFKLADADKNASLDEDEILVLASEFRRNKLSPADQNTEMKNRPTGGAPATTLVAGGKPIDNPRLYRLII